MKLESKLYLIKSSTYCFHFQLGEEFEETTPDGRDVTTLAALEVRARL